MSDHRCGFAQASGGQPSFLIPNQPAPTAHSDMPQHQYFESDARLTHASATADPSQTVQPSHSTAEYDIPMPENPVQNMASPFGQDPQSSVRYHENGLASQQQPTTTSFVMAQATPGQYLNQSLMIRHDRSELPNQHSETGFSQEQPTASFIPQNTGQYIMTQQQTSQNDFQRSQQESLQHQNATFFLQNNHQYGFPVPMNQPILQAPSQHSGDVFPCQNVSFIPQNTGQCMSQQQTNQFYFQHSQQPWQEPNADFFQQNNAHQYGFPVPMNQPILQAPSQHSGDVFSCQNVSFVPQNPGQNMSQQQTNQNYFQHSQQPWQEPNAAFFQQNNAHQYCFPTSTNQPALQTTSTTGDVFSCQTQGNTGRYIAQPIRQNSCQLPIQSSENTSTIWQQPNDSCIRQDSIQNAARNQWPDRSQLQMPFVPAQQQPLTNYSFPGQNTTQALPPSQFHNQETAYSDNLNGSANNNNNGYPGVLGEILTPEEFSSRLTFTDQHQPKAARDVKQKYQQTNPGSSRPAPKRKQKTYDQSKKSLDSTEHAASSFSLFDDIDFLYDEGGGYLQLLQHAHDNPVDVGLYIDSTEENQYFSVVSKPDFAGELKEAMRSLLVFLKSFAEISDAFYHLPTIGENDGDVCRKDCDIESIQPKDLKQIETELDFYDNSVWEFFDDICQVIQYSRYLSAALEGNSPLKAKLIGSLPLLERQFKHGIEKISHKFGLCCTEQRYLREYLPFCCQNVDQLCSVELGDWKWMCHLGSAEACKFCFEHFGNRKTLDVRTSKGETIRLDKANFKRVPCPGRKEDIVRCQLCKKDAHAICVKYALSDDAFYYCDDCMNNNPNSAENWRQRTRRARDLKECNDSFVIERELNSLEAVLRSQVKLVVRLMDSHDSSFEMSENYFKMFFAHCESKQVCYRSKVFAVFQELDDGDIMDFMIFVDEFYSNRWAHLSYVEGAKHLPSTIRSTVYQASVVALFKCLKQRGYRRVFTDVRPLAYREEPAFSLRPSSYGSHWTPEQRLENLWQNFFSKILENANHIIDSYEPFEEWGERHRPSEFPQVKNNHLLRMLEESATETENQPMAFWECLKTKIGRQHGHKLIVVSLLNDGDVDRELTMDDDHFQDAAAEPSYVNEYLKEGPRRFWKVFRWNYYEFSIKRHALYSTAKCINYNK